MRTWSKVALLAFCAGLPLLMAPSSSGIPSRPRFQSVGVGQTAPSGAGNLTATGTVAAFNVQSDFASITTMAAVTATITNLNGAGLATFSSATPELRFMESDASANNQLWGWRVEGEQLCLRVLDDTASSAATVLCVDRTGNTVDLINLQATAVQANGVAVATGESGTFAATLTTGCTTTPSLNFRWARAGNVVTIASTGTTTCTSNSNTVLLTAAVPAAIRPTVNQCVAYIMATDNGVGTNAAVQIQTDGDINIAEGLGSNCSALSWTSSGTKTLNEWNGSYVLN